MRLRRLQPALGVAARRTEQAMVFCKGVSPMNDPMKLPALDLCLLCHSDAHKVLKIAFLDFLEGKFLLPEGGKDVKFKFCS